ALPQPARPGGAMDKGRQAGGEADAAFLSPLSRQRGAAVAELDRLQPREFVPAVGAADEGRHLVANQLAAAVGEDRRTAHPTCALLLVAVGRGAPDAAIVWWHAAEDRNAVGAGGIRRAQRGANFDDAAGTSRQKCQRIRSEKRQFRVSYVSARQNWPVAARWRGLRAQTRPRTSRLPTPGVGATLNQN